MQPEQPPKPEPELKPESEVQLSPEDGKLKKKNEPMKTALVAIAVFALLLFLFTPRSSGHGATRSSRLRAEQRQAEISRATASTGNQLDDTSDH